MNEFFEILLALIKYEITGTKLDENIKNKITAEIMPDLYCVAKKHEMAHLVGDALYKNGLVFEDNPHYKEFQKEQYLAFYSVQLQMNELNKISKLFEEEKVPFIALKGAVIRQYYPQSWLRNSSDLDILVKHEHHERACKLLAEKLEYSFDQLSAHDQAFRAKSGVYVELHHDILDLEKNPNSAEITEKIWERSVLKAGCSYTREMDDELFYFHHISHISKHFLDGGCGIKPLADICVLKNASGRNFSGTNEFIKQFNLTTFAVNIERLCDCWFGEEKPDLLLEKMQDYILSGFVYGTLTNRMAVHQIKKGGKANYAISRFFYPYDLLKYQYPILIKRRWLTPVFEVVRWFRIIFTGGIKRSVRKLKENGSVSKETSCSVADMLEMLEL